MSWQTLDKVRKALSHIPNAQLQIPMNPLNPASTPQVAAVTQTLAGERMTQTITFPTTGDNDCDVIQGVLAVIEAIGQSSDRVAVVLRYLAERVHYNGKQHSQISEMDNLVRRQSNLEQQVRDFMSLSALGHYSSLGGLGGPINPSNPTGPMISSWSAIPDHIKQQAGPTTEQLAHFVGQISNQKSCAQIISEQKPKP